MLASPAASSSGRRNVFYIYIIAGSVLLIIAGFVAKEI